MSDAMNTLLAFAYMDGYALFVWGSLGMCALVMLAEVLWLRTRRAALMREAGSPLEHLQKLKQGQP